MPSADGLYVTLGAGSDLDAELETRVAAASAAQPAASPAAEASLIDEAPAEDALEIAQEAIAEELGEESEATLDEDAGIEEIASVTPAQGPIATGAVHGIHFDSQPDRDRVVVLSEGVIDYVVHTPDAETVVLSLPGASIAREAEGRITPEVGGPISLVTTFAQPEVPGGEVRVVMKRAPNLEPMVSRRGSLLFVDFENTGVAAAPPPAFEETQPVDDTATLASATAAPGEPARFESIESGGETVVAALNPAASAALDGVAGFQVENDISDLPQFSQPASFEGTPVAGAGPMDIDMAGPASLEPPASVDLLEEGGLIDGKEYRGRRISLDFKDVQIADVLRIIAEVSDLNVVAGEEVAGTVTIRLVDVPWDQALDVILLTKGLGFVRVGNVLRIAPAEIIAQEEEVRLQERRNKEKLEDLVVKLQPVNYADVEDAAKLVEKLLSARGSVNVDNRTNTLILKDISSVVDEASALIMAVDTQTPQVMIEAKIVEANLDFSRELGSIWAFGANPFKDGFNPNAGPRTNLGDDDFLFHDANNVIFANPITSLANGLGTLNAFILDEKFNLSVSLAAAESTGDGKVISSPRIVTLDNREAEIEQGVSIPFQTFEGGDAKLEFIDAVLQLKVTPHISADKSIVMQIAVTRNAPDDSIPTPTGSPAIAKNEAETETLVKDGQTLVIGGIYTVVQTTRESRVPYLHKLPLIGNAFRSKEVTDSRKELLIFVTPRIVTLPDAG
jgi:type IV pilus assembly protein PilQ